jgi:hypothetical protein
MNISFEDFTLVNFRNLLRIAKGRFRFCNYSEYANYSNFILWRHDIDASVDYSLKLAKIEYEEGVKANYFVWLHSELYSPFEKETYLKLKMIESLGHEMGIHFDTHFYSIVSQLDLEEALQKEILLFKDVLGFEPKTFSFHNPTKEILKFDHLEYCGLKNTYSKEIFTNVPYCSDSNGYWRFDRLEDKLLDPAIQNLQVLTHPEWWQETVKRPSERLKFVIQTRADTNWEFYLAGLEKFGRNNL